MTNIDVRTFGCRLNAYESEIIKDNALKAGLTNAIIFNSCAVTTEAERQVRQAIRKARKLNPNMKIIVTGCAAQINPGSFAEMPEVDQIVGNNEKLKQNSFNPLNTERLLVNDIMSVRETADHLVAGFDGKTRAFVQVQNGCDHRCTFCTIPFGRGNSRSVPIGVIVDQVRTFVQNGYKEIVLTGVDITSYGQDLPGTPTLGQMMRRLLSQVPEFPRLRLSSLDPVEVDEDIFRLLESEPRLMPHLHISLQAGDDLILKRMKRRHLRQDILDFCARARSLRPDVVFGADVIAGFPTETDGMFLNTLELMGEITYFHVFPYSPRPGTPAAKMPQVSKNVIKERARILREKGEAVLKNHLENLIGKTMQVLVEHGNVARTEYFSPVDMQGHKATPGDMLMMHFQGIKNHKLIGEIIS